jgi:hypothetical protein
MARRCQLKVRDGGGMGARDYLLTGDHSGFCIDSSLREGWCCCSKVRRLLKMRLSFANGVLDIVTMSRFCH